MLCEAAEGWDEGGYHLLSWKAVHKEGLLNSQNKRGYAADSNMPYEDWFKDLEELTREDLGGRQQAVPADNN